jgi:hypothetical protein
MVGTGPGSCTLRCNGKPSIFVETKKSAFPGGRLLPALVRVRIALCVASVGIVRDEGSCKRAGAPRTLAADLRSLNDAVRFDLNDVIGGLVGCC